MKVRVEAARGESGLWHFSGAGASQRGPGDWKPQVRGPWGVEPSSGAPRSARPAAPPAAEWALAGRPGGEAPGGTVLRIRGLPPRWRRGPGGRRKRFGPRGGKGSRGGVSSSLPAQLWLRCRRRRCHSEMGGGHSNRCLVGAPASARWAPTAFPVTSLLAQPASWGAVRPLLQTRRGQGVNGLAQASEGPAEN